jgi:four helix bundle protein
LKTDNLILTKTYEFALRIVRLSQFFIDEKRAYQLADQVRRSGTSIGATMEEAIGGQSRRDFIAKCSIAYKEARETHYWLRLLRDTDFISEKQASSLLSNCEEILKILTTILRTTKAENPDDLANEDPSPYDLIINS